MQFGPDGALYVVDWFNPLVGHMQYSLRDPRRDKTHGRVWRITAKGRPLLTPPRIHGATIAEQLDLLKAYEDRTRYQARLALRDRPTGGGAAGGAALDRRPRSERIPHYEHHLLEALWVHEHHDAVNRPLLERLLAAKEFRARAAAVRVLQHWFDRVDDAMALLAPTVRDEAPRVRLEAVRALSFVPTRRRRGSGARRARQADGLLPAVRPRLDDDARWSRCGSRGSRAARRSPRTTRPAWPSSSNASSRASWRR